MELIRSYCHSACNIPLVDRTLHEQLDITAALQPQKEAYVFYDANCVRTALTYHEWCHMSRVLAIGLRNIGICPHQKVGLLLPNCKEFCLVHLALSRIGASTVMLRLGSKNLKDVATMLDTLDCKVVVTSCLGENENSGCGLSEDKAKLLLQERQLDKIIYLEDPKLTISEVYSLSCIKSQVLNVDVNSYEFPETESDDNALILLSSGTTSAPKPIPHTHRALINSCLFYGMHLQMNEKSTLFNDRPLGYIVGTLAGIGQSLLGVRVVTVLASLASKGNQIETLIKVLSDEKCTHGILFGYLLYDITTNPNALKQNNLNSFRNVIVGGQTVPQNIRQGLCDLLPGIRIIDPYGCSETVVTSITDLDCDPVTCKNVGRPLPHLEVTIRDAETGKTVAVGDPGEIWVRGYSVLHSYLVKPSVDASGWFHTGDLGRLDARGYLYFLGRLKDIIKRAGVVIYPVEIEAILIQCSQVKEVQVVGVPDARLGQDMCACIIPRTALTAEQLKSWSADKFGKDVNGLSMCPSHTVIVEHFPRTATGKVDRRLLETEAQKRINSWN